MNERRDFLKIVAAGPAGALLLPLFAETGSRSLAADVECAAGRLPKNIIYSKAHEGVWKGKSGSHLPNITATRDGDLVKVRVETKHGMSESHYIVRHTIVAQCGEVLGAKTFSWKDEPVSTYELKLPPMDKPQTVYVTSYCSKHDLWLLETKVQV